MDIEQFLTPLSEESPAGPDCEYEPEFGELERTARGTPEKRTGDAVIEAVPPAWRDVRDQAVALLGTTRDLRVAVLLSHALLHLEGFEGLRDGLKLCLRLSEVFWDSVHPQLDEDDGDATFRCNAVLELVNREGLLRSVLEVPFINARVAGSYTLRDLKVIAGELHQREGDDRPTPQAQFVEAAFREQDPEAVAAIESTIAEAIEALAGIEAFYTSQIGAVDAPDLAELTAELTAIHKCIQAEMARLGLAEEPVAETAGEAGGSVAMAPSQGISGDVQSRDDVLRTIEKLCRYYEVHEPSSPVPILLRRAAGLVNKSFMEIVADLTPSGVSEAERYAPSDGAGSQPESGVESSSDSW